MEELNKELLKEKEEEFFNKVHKIEESGEAGGGFVKVRLNYKCEIIKIDCEDNPHLKGDIPMLLDLVIMAHNAARQKVEDQKENHFFEFMSGFVKKDPSELREAMKGMSKIFDKL